MRTKLVIIFLTVFVLGANAAPPISGRVTDIDGLPLIGATVEIKGTTSATKTDENGNFSLDVSSGQTLVVSFIGYQSREVQVEDLSAPLTIQLIADDALLDEVVVVSYGTQ